MNTSILFTLRRIGLNPRLGFKVKDQQNNDLAVLRFNAMLGEWLNLLPSAQQCYTETEALNFMSGLEAAGGHIVVFDCCCFECASTDRKNFWKQFVAETGLGISHGYWPECAVKMDRIYREAV